MSGFNQNSGYVDLFNQSTANLESATIGDLTVTVSLTLTGAQLIGFPVDNVTLELTGNILQVKDGGITDIKIVSVSASKITGIILNDVNNDNTTSNNMNTDIINEKTLDAGVTIEGVLIKDGQIDIDEVSFEDGDVNDPSISFISEETLGIYKKSLHNIAFASNGVNPFTINDTSILSNVQSLFGTLALGQLTPTISFIIDPGTGIEAGVGSLRLIASQNIVFTSTNTENISNRQLQCGGYGPTFATPQFTDVVRTNTGLYIDNTASLGLSLVVSGSQKLQVLSTYTESFQKLILQSGIITNLALQIGIFNTGFYENVGNELVINVLGVEVLKMYNNLIKPQVQTLFPTTGQLTPPISFIIDPGTGIEAGVGSLRLIASQNIVFTSTNTENISNRQLQCGGYGPTFATPQFADTVRTNTGLYIDNTASLGLSLVVSGSEIVNVNPTSTIINNILKVDNIEEKTLNNGVTIESINIKDTTIDIDTKITASTTLNFARPNTRVVQVLGLISDQFIIQGQLKFRTNPVFFYAPNNNSVCAVVSGIFIQCWNAAGNTSFGAPIFSNSYIAINDIRGNSAVPLIIGATSSTSVSLGASNVPTIVNGDLIYQRSAFDCYGEFMANITLCTTPFTMYKVNFGTNILTTVNKNFTIGTDGKITYNYATSKYLHMSITFSFEDNKQANDLFEIFKNGSRVAGSSAYLTAQVGANSTNLQKIFRVDQNDYMELYVSSSLANNSIQVIYANLLGFVLEDTI